MHGPEPLLNQRRSRSWWALASIGVPARWSRRASTASSWGPTGHAAAADLADAPFPGDGAWDHRQRRPLGALPQRFGELLELSSSREKSVSGLAQVSDSCLPGFSHFPLLESYARNFSCVRVCSLGSLATAYPGILGLSSGSLIAVRPWIVPL